MKAMACSSGAMVRGEPVSAEQGRQAHVTDVAPAGL